jgi:hypothetical protein
MDTDERSRTALWRDIDALLVHARVARPLRCADALLDLARLAAEGATTPPIARLVAALEGWDGRLLVSAPDDALAPAVRAGDRVVVDPAAEPREGSVVLAFADGTLALRRLTWRDGRQWLATDAGAAMPLGPGVAILGVAVELRRALDRCQAA